MVESARVGQGGWCRGDDQAQQRRCLFPTLTGTPGYAVREHRVGGAGRAEGEGVASCPCVEAVSIASSQTLV